MALHHAHFSTKWDAMHYLQLLVNPALLSVCSLYSMSRAGYIINICMLGYGLGCVSCGRVGLGVHFNNFSILSEIWAVCIEPEEMLLHWARILEWNPYILGECSRLIFSTVHRQGCCICELLNRRYTIKSAYFPNTSNRITTYVTIITVEREIKLEF